MEKGIADQWIVQAFYPSTGAAATGVTITANLFLDGSSSGTATTDVNPTELENGFYQFNMTSSENNVTNQQLLTPTATSGVEVIARPNPRFPRPENFHATGIQPDGDITKVNTLDGHTPQTGDTFPELPTNFSSLSISSGGAITNVLTTTDVTNQVSADVTAISGDTTAADNLELQYDTTGLSGGTFPATQDQISNIANTGAAINKVAAGATINTGTQTNTYTATHNLDGTYHELAHAAGSLDVDYNFNIGSTGIPVSITFVGRLFDPPTTNDSITIQAYNWDTLSYDTVSSLDGVNSSDDSTKTVILFSNNVGTGANAGEVDIKFLGSSLGTGTILYLDLLYCSFSVVASSVGYANGQIWVDTVNGTAGTAKNVNGVADLPVLTWADALSLITITGLSSFHIINGSTITLTGNSTNYTLSGDAWTLALNNQSIAGIHVNGASVSGSATGIGYEFHDCKFAAITIAEGEFKRCSFGDASGNFTSNSVGDYIFENCYSVVPGSGAPSFDFSGEGGTVNINNRGWLGGATYTLDSNCMLSHEVFAGGTLTINANGGDVEIRGVTRAVILNVTGGETIQFVGITGHITINGNTTITQPDINIYGVVTDVTDNTTGLGSDVDIDAVNWEDQQAILLDTGTTIPAQITSLNDVSAAEVRTEMEGDNSDLDYLVTDLINKKQIRIATGISTQYNDSDTSLGSISTGYSDDGIDVVRPRQVIVKP